MKEELKHQLARDFMDKFPHLEQHSLDEWIGQHENVITECEYNTAYSILRLFDDEEVIPNRKYFNIGWDCHDVDGIDVEAHDQALQMFMRSWMNEPLMNGLDITFIKCPHDCTGWLHVEGPAESVTTDRLQDIKDELVCEPLGQLLYYVVIIDDGEEIHDV
jgi:hypothetical protein